MIVNSVLSALLQLLLFSIPSSIYVAWHRIHNRLSWHDLCARLGLIVGQRHYLAYAVLFMPVSAGLAVLMVRSLPPELFLHDHSPQRPFVGMGFSAEAVLMAILYGFIQTGLSEELFFRGLIAGAIGRRLTFWPANIFQSLVFLLFHVILIVFEPSMWPLVIGTALGVGLVTGWLRLKSGSVLSPWLVHASINTASCLTVAATVSSTT